MKIKIYQVNMERDPNDVCFMGYDRLEKLQGTTDIDSTIYDKVFEGEVNCFTLEKLYEIFNREHPAGYKGRSMSVSDVVEIVDGTTGKSYFNFCDSFGFKQIEFEPDKTQISERFCDGDKAETISVLLIQPGKYPKTVAIEDSLEAMQALVGGDIEEYMPFEDEVAIICNEEGKVNGLPLNRAVYAEEEVDMGYSEMAQKFREAEKNGEHLDGYIVFTEDSFTEKYPLESRTYVVSSDNKAYRPNMGGYSIYATSLDGTDKNVRLEAYMAAEKGGKDGWKIERCYMKEREMIEIMAGDFFICHAPISSEKFMSLPPDLEKKYSEKFRYPEKFVQTDKGIKAIPYKPAARDMER
mgnify:FL=1